MWPFFAVFIFSVIIGSTFIVIAYVIGSISAKSDNDDNSSKQDKLDSSLIEQRLIKSIEDADSALEQLTNMSGLIFEELEGKYKELLFLYQLIDEKKAEVSNVYSKNLELFDSFKDALANVENSNSVLDNNDSSDSANSLSVYIEEPPLSFDNSLYSDHPRYSEIFSLFNEGMSISDIAKTLSIGQGEVKLIIELGRMRNNSNIHNIENLSVPAE